MKVSQEVFCLLDAELFHTIDGGRCVERLLHRKRKEKFVKTRTLMVFILLPSSWTENVRCWMVHYLPSAFRKCFLHLFTNGAVDILPGRCVTRNPTKSHQIISAFRQCLRSGQMRTRVARECHQLSLMSCQTRVRVVWEFHQLSCPGQTRTRVAGIRSKRPQVKTSPLFPSQNGPAFCRPRVFIIISNNSSKIKWKALDYIYFKMLNL